MTAKNSNSVNHLHEYDCLGELTQDVAPSEELVEKTVAAMQCAARDRSRSNAARRAGAPAVGPLVSRRRFVALGGVCAATAAIGIGVPLALRQTASDGAVETLSPTFGLKIAQAAEPGKSVTIEPENGSLMQLSGTDQFRCIELLLNLSCTGDNIQKLIFSLLNVPTQVVAGSHSYDSEEMTEWPLVSFSKDLAYPRDEEKHNEWLANEYESVEWSDRSLIVDLQEDPTWDGTRETDYGTECDLICTACSEDDLWVQDSVMAAKNAWLEATTSTLDEVSQEERDALESAYIEAYQQVSATQEDAVAWARQCFVNCMALAAQSLAQTTLQVEASFSDGSTATSCYRIAPVDNFEDAMGSRYDALYELRSCESDLDYHIAPFYSFLDEYHDASEDPRLSVALFNITDVTDSMQG